MGKLNVSFNKKTKLNNVKEIIKFYREYSEIGDFNYNVMRKVSYNKYLQFLLSC